MTEPTDKEQYLNIADQCSATATSDLAASILVDGGSGTLRQLLNDAADAIRAGWGTPPAVAGEPVAWQVWWGLGEMRPHWPPFKTQNDAADHASMIRSCTEVRPLYTTPQPTQAQAGAVPLTDSTARSLVWSASDWARSESINEDDVLEIVRATEAAHGIKGGQHGADT